MLPTPVLLVDEGQMGKKNLFAGVQILIQSLVKVGISSMVISEQREQINGQFRSLQNFQQNLIQITKFFTFHGKDGSNFHKATISRAPFHPVQDAVCGIASATLLKVEGNIRIMIQVGTAKTEFFKVVTVKPRIVESLHTQASPEQSHDHSFRKTGQTHFNSFINSSILHKHSAQGPNQTHHLKTFSSSTNEMQRNKSLKEKIT